MLDLDGSNVAENFKEWKDLLDIYMLASGSNKKNKKLQNKTLFLIMQDYKWLNLPNNLHTKMRKRKMTPMFC